jgi:hypothetical protein
VHKYKVVLRHIEQKPYPAGKAAQNTHGLGRQLAWLVQNVPGSHRYKGRQPVLVAIGSQRIEVLLETKALGRSPAGRIRNNE